MKRYGRWLRRWAPVLVGLLAFGVAVWGCLAIRSAFPHAGFAQRFFATLAMFTGGYVPLDDTTPVPPTSVAIPSMLAFGLTFATAVWVIVVLTTKRLRTAYRLCRAHPQLVVVGSEETASAIVKSALAENISTVLVAESDDSPAARAADGGALVVTVASIETCTETKSVRSLLTRGQNVVLATDFAPANLALRDRIAPDRKSLDAAERHEHSSGGHDDFRSLIAVVHDPVLAETMRPATLTELTEVDVTCPAENVAEHVCHLIDAATTSPDVFDSARPTLEAVTVQVVGVEARPDEAHVLSHIAETIELWVRRLSWSRVFLNGDKRSDGLYNPIVPITLIPADAPARARGLNIRIYAGGPQAVIAQAVEDRAHHNYSQTELTIVVTDRAMARTAHTGLDGSRPDDILSGHEWLELKAPTPKPDTGASRVVVVDPVAVGLDARLVVDDANLQWARMFHQTYNFMFADKKSVIPWEPGAPLGDAVAAEEERAERKARAETPRDNDKRTLEERIAAEKIDARKKISDRYSNRFAVAHMLTQLKAQGFEIVRLPLAQGRCPVAPAFPKDDVEAMAKAEHAHWRSARSWKDRRRRPRTLGQRLSRHTPAPKEHLCSEDSSSGADLFSFEQLANPTAPDQPPADSEAPDLALTYEQKLAQIHERRRIRQVDYVADDEAIHQQLATAAEYNRRIITETYPALAARFGYAIVREGTKPFPTNRGDDNTQWPTYERYGLVVADQLSDRLTWTTDSGDELAASTGDWVIEDLNGKRWTSMSKFFTTTDGPAYRNVRDNIYQRVGQVRARPAVQDELVDSLAGEVRAGEYGWIVHGESGDRWPVSSHHFARYYRVHIPPVDRSGQA